MSRFLKYNYSERGGVNPNKKVIILALTSALFLISSPASADFSWSGTISQPDDMPGVPNYLSSLPGENFTLASENGNYIVNVIVKNGAVAPWEETTYYLASFDSDTLDTFHFDNLHVTLKGDFNHDHVWHDYSKTVNRPLRTAGFYNRYTTYGNATHVTYNIDSLYVDLDATLKGWHINPNAVGNIRDGNETPTTINIGDSYIRSIVRVDDAWKDKAEVSNNGVYTSGEGMITNLNGNTYVNAILPDGLQEAYSSDYAPGMSKNDALSAKYGGKVTVNATGGHKVELLGNLDVKKGVMTVNLDTPESYWHGHGTNLSSESNLTVTLKNRAQWVPDLPIEIMQNLIVKDGGTINLHGFNKHTGKSGLTQQLSVAKLTGDGGTVIMDLSTSQESGPIADPRYDVTDSDWEASDTTNRKVTDNHNDFLYVKEGNGSLSVLPVDANKLAGVTKDKPIWFADVPNDITFTAFAEKASLSDGFVYDYTPLVDKNVVDADASKNGTNWYIVGVDKTPTTTTETTIADTALNYAAATSFLELDSLNKRLGEIRHYGDSKAGLWVRAKAGRITSDTNGYFRSNYQFYQLGSDYVYKPTNGAGTFLFGGAIHTANHDAKYDQGSGDTDTVGGSLYLSWFNPQGFYADLIGRYTHLKDDYSIDARGESVKASYSNDAWSLSVEGGKRFDIGQSFSIEPEAQLVYTHVTGIDYTLSNGMRIDQDSANSLIGRLGVRLGRDFRFSEELAPSKVYFKADVYREFAGDRDVRLTGQDATLTRDVDGGDTWFTYGIGADFSVTKNLFFYADVQKSAGGDVDTKWEVNGGLRWAF